jgi:4-hydroxy-3-polyprenylbenzoate decarboxylase
MNLSPAAPVSARAQALQAWVGLPAFPNPARANLRHASAQSSIRPAQAAGRKKNCTALTRRHCAKARLRLKPIQTERRLFLKQRFAILPGQNGLKILIAITGASGALYAQRLLDNLDSRTHEIHVVLSNYAQQVIAGELPGGLRLPAGAKMHNIKSMNAPFASGSNPPDAMVVIPCTMGTLGRIAHGYSEDILLRAADVVLKEKKKLILVPRETPLNLVHVKNFELLMLAGATILPANPIFYTNPKTIQEVVDTVVARVLDHLGIPQKLAPRWAEEKE